MENASVRKLIGILDQESLIYNDILKISKNKKNLIVDGKVSELENLVKMEQALIVKIGKLESDREEEIKFIAQEYNADNLNITGLMKLIDNTQAKELEKSRNNMLKILGELKENNDLNCKLVKNSLEYIDFSINILSPAEADKNYSNMGKVNAPKKKNLFDVKM